MPNKINNICPICGFPDLDEPAYDAHGCSSYDICPCCGTQFGYHDANKSHEVLRELWIQAGSNWHSSSSLMPKNWNPNEQVKTLLD